MDNTETINVLSLCTGYGGLELGLACALEGVFRIVAVEVEAFALANLAAKAQEGGLAIEAMWPDIATFPAGKFRGCFDFIVAGYPCQPFSVAGKRKGTEDPRYLWPHIERIIEAVRPVWCFFENVPGHLAVGFADVYCSLRNLGYSVEAGLFTAAECGAPHKRERLFILAHDTTSGFENVQVQQAGQSAFWHGSRRLADSGQKGSRGQRHYIKDGRCVTGSYDRCLSSTWPARPGQPQYEWEEPRVVGNTTTSGLKSGKRKSKIQRKKEQNTSLPESGTTEQQRQAQSRVGGAVNGTSCRVDRLRLLGNGVVPQCAELAFKSLYEKIAANAASIEERPRKRTNRKARKDAAE